MKVGIKDLVKKNLKWSLIGENGMRSTTPDSIVALGEMQMVLPTMRLEARSPSSPLYLSLP